MNLSLGLTADRLTVCQLPADAVLPGWATNATGFVSITRTAEELSIVCAENAVPKDIKQVAGWRAFQVEGPLDFSLTGVLASIAGPLAEAGISIFAVATFHTDYVLVQAANVEAASHALRRAGHKVRSG